MKPSSRHYEAEAVTSSRSGRIADGVKSGHYIYLLRRGHFEVSIAGNRTRAKAGSIVWIGGGVPRVIRCGRQTEWTIVRLRNRGLAPGNEADAYAWNIILRLGQLGRIRPRLPLTTVTAEELHRIADKMLALEAGESPGRSLLMKAASLGFLAVLDRDPALGRAMEQHPVDTTQASLIQRVLQLIEDESEQILSVSDLAERSGASRSSLYRAFAASGMPSPATLLERIRLERAGRLLRERGATVLAVAMDTGFSSLSAFYRAFHRAYGVAPGVWRRGGGRD